VTQVGSEGRRLAELSSRILSCTRCPLHLSRLHAVPGEGSPNALLVLVGEAPGYNEDREGRPFVGQAGKILDELLALAGLEREQVYITNLVKCRPPRNRPPRKGEIETCSSYLAHALRILGPRVLVPLGRYSLSFCLGMGGLDSRPISEVHGRRFETVMDWGGVELFPMYHPAVALYTNGMKAVLEDDMGSLRLLLVERGYV